MIHSKPCGKLWLQINRHWSIYRHGYLMKSDWSANVKLRMPRATLLHSTREVLVFQTTHGGIAQNLKSVGAQVEKLHDLSYLMNNRMHVSTELKKLQLGNKSRDVAIVGRLAIGTRSVFILQDNMYQPEAYQIIVRQSILAHLRMVLLLSTLHDRLTWPWQCQEHTWFNLLIKMYKPHIGLLIVVLHTTCQNNIHGSLTIRVPCVLLRILNSIDGLSTSMFSITSSMKHF